MPVTVWNDGRIEQWPDNDPRLPRDLGPAPSLPLPDISDRQFFQQMAVEDQITEAEAEDAVASGTIPPSLMALVNALPSGDRFAARMFLKGATVFKRRHPVTIAIAQLKGWNDAKLDQVWRDASIL